MQRFGGLEAEQPATTTVPERVRGGRMASSPSIYR